MTQDDIIEMVNQVGCKSYSPPPTRSVAGVSMTFAQVEELIKLAAAKEREACAKVCEQFQKDYVYTADLAGAVAAIKHRMADAIRARGDA